MAESNAEKIITVLLNKLINDKKEVDVELSFEKPLPRKQERGRNSSRSNNRRRRSDNRDRKPKNERRSTDKKFFDKKGRRMQNK